MGAFSKIVPPILRAAVVAKFCYVDICDDLAPS